jgi:hypothetical protein
MFRSNVGNYVKIVKTKYYGEKPLKLQYEMINN